ncbi:hypothetical protein WHR41_03413 [Cladosporium halotolerans]|uniref:Major facilitator superfamily (MFS) profile domain-containing protein n=1 Tax=Cladosporium halotolerans TaxID=1052096 RepID=A0AB34KTB0_9PEZI
MNTKRDVDMVEDKDRDSISLDKEAQVTYQVKPGMTADDAEWLANVPPKEQDRIFHKVDIRLVPMLALLYLIAHLDRANIGNAKIEGLEASLGMVDTDYNVAVGVFFVPYVLCEVPSNLLLAKFKKASWYMGFLVVCWGIIMTLTGCTQSFGGLVACRFLLGVFEAGFFPGAIWIVSEWYPPHKSQMRMAMFYLSSALSGAFSGLLAAGIAQMRGLGGYEGWRWIFILEGIVSVVVGISCFFLLPDNPSSASWLKPDESRFLDLMHTSTRGKAVKHEGEEKKSHHWKTLWQVLTDKQMYFQALVFASNSVPNYGLKFTMPQIIRNMGYTSTRAQLLTAPPYACGAIAAVTSAYFADKLTWRMPFIVASQCLLVIAYSVLFVFAPNIADNVPLCYVMVFLACISVYPILPGCNAWTINNLANAEKRSMGIAFMICIGNLGGLPGSFIFLQRESPQYPTGFGTSLAFGGAGLVSALLLEYFYWSHNKKWEKVPEEEIRAKYSDEELDRLGNKSPLFRYAL